MSMATREIRRDALESSTALEIGVAAPKASTLRLVSTPWEVDPPAARLEGGVGRAYRRLRLRRPRPLYR